MLTNDNQINHLIKFYMLSKYRLSFLNLSLANDFNTVIPNEKGYCQ